MAEYTATREGFQKSMKWSLTGRPEDAKEYAEATATPNFYHIMNGKREDYNTWFQGLVEWRGKTSDYELEIHEFLRDGNQLAARMTGTIKVEGAPMKFECFYFGTVDEASGKLSSLTERAVWGPVDGPAEHGVS